MKRYIFISIALAGCTSFARAETTAAKVEAKAGEIAQDVRTEFFDLVNKDSVVVSFEKGKSAVSESELKNLEALVKSTREDAKIARIIVASWSDKEYPEGKAKELSQADTNLAEARSAAVDRAIKTFGVTSIETHTMASEPTWIQKTFNTTEARLKDAKVQRGDGDMVSVIGKRLRDKGGPGKAVVLVRRLGQTPSH